jgi:hypothetical protein
MISHIQKLRRITKPVKFWQYVIENKDKLVLTLDNDETIITHKNSKDDEFDDEFATPPGEWLGNSEGICNFLTALGIKFKIS